jgi:hypothetical protein
MVDAATCGSPRSTGLQPNSRNTRATDHPRTPGWVKYSVLDDIIDVTGREFAGSMTYRDVARAAAQAAVLIAPAQTLGGRVASRSAAGRDRHRTLRADPIHPDRVIAWGLDEERRRRIANARQGASRVPAVRHVVCLGSPHLGAPGEKGVAVLSRALAGVAETRAFAFLLDERSAGIKDLRHGYLTDDDWRDCDPDSARRRLPQADRAPPERQPLCRRRHRHSRPFASDCPRSR